MSSDIGYGATAIRSGEVKYQQALVDLMRQAAAKKPANDSAPADSKQASSETAPTTGKTVDIKV